MPQDTKLFSKIADFFKPVPNKVRVRDVAREIPGTFQRGGQAFFPKATDLDELRSSILRDNPSIDASDFARINKEVRQHDLTTTGAVRIPNTNTLIDPTGFIGGIENVGKRGLQKISQTFDPKSYVDELVGKQQAAKDLGSPSEQLLDKGRRGIADIKSKVIDSAAPIEDTLNQSLKKHKISLLPSQDITNQLDRVMSSRTIANVFMEEKGLGNVIKNLPEGQYDAFNQYLIAKQSNAVNTRGIETGRDFLKDTALIKNFQHEFEPLAKQVKQYTKEMLDYSVDAGLISREVADNLNKIYPDYVPMNRIFPEILEEGGTFSRQGLANLSKQNIFQRLEGSAREVENPLESLMNRTADMFAQGEKNKAARLLAGYKGLPDNPFGLRPLVTEADVRMRKELFSNVKEYKPIANKLNRIIKTGQKEIHKLDRELRRLNERGLKTALNPKNIKAKKDLRTGVRTVEGPNGQVIFTAEEMKVPMSPRLTKQYVARMIEDPKINLTKIKNMIDKREVKLRKLMDELIERKEEYQGVRELITKNLYEAADKAPRIAEEGKDTISFFKNGVKEVWEVNKDIADSAKSLNVKQMGLLAKIISYPVRVAKVGITGLSPGFFAANPVRDQLGAFIFSKHSRSTANPHVFMKGFTEAIGKGHLFKEMAREGAGIRMVDLLRGQVKQNVKRLQAGKSKKSKIKHLVKTPGDLFRALEDVVSITEVTTRTQQFVGTKKALMKKGMSEKEAIIGAARAARENTVNFQRRGEWGSALGGAFLYLNAGIQGGRLLTRRMMQDPKGTSAKIAAGLYMPVVMATVWNTADPERKAIYDDIADFEKENNLIFIPPGAKKDPDTGKWNIIKIPLPPGVGALASIPRRMLEAHNGSNPLEARDIYNNLFKSVSPVGTSQREIMSTVVPQAVKPSVENLVNQNLFTGQPIVPASMKDLSPELQARANTSGTARIIGKQLDVSPLQVQAWIRGTFGTASDQVFNISDRILAGLNLIPKEQIGGKGIAEAMSARFTQAVGGETSRKQQEIIQEELTEQADQKFINKQEAEIIFGQLSQLPEKERAEMLVNTQQNKADVYDSLKRLIADEAKGLDYSDRLLMQLNVKNGARADYIAEALQSMEAEQQTEYINELVRKKVLTKTVLKQVTARVIRANEQ